MGRGIGEGRRTPLVSQSHLHGVQVVHELVLSLKDVEELGADMAVAQVDVGVQAALEQQADGADMGIFHTA